MQITFSDKTKLTIDNCIYDQMSNWLYIYVLTDDFNSLVPIFKSEELLNEIMVDNGTKKEKYSGYTKTDQFFGIVKDDGIFTTVILKKE